MNERLGSATRRGDGQQPTVGRLERAARGGGTGWRLPAALLSVALVAVVVAGRLEVPESPTVDLPVASGSPAAVATARPVSVDRTPRPSGPPPLPIVPDAYRYHDGIPTSVRARPVHRVGAALLHRGERVLMLGGWYVPPSCLLTDRCLARLADSPAAAGDPERSIFLTGISEDSTGPRVLRGRIGEECPRDSGACMTVLHVGSVVWRGDLFTRTAPIEPQPLLTALGEAFPGMRAEPFRDLARCPVPWPLQTYRSTSGGPRMTLVFPTVRDRAAAEPAIVANWPTPAAGSGGQCTDHLIDEGAPAGWLTHQNVMVWVGEDDHVRGLTDAALDQAQARSDPDAEVVAGAITPWAALRALQGFEAEIDILPPHDLWIEIWSDARDSTYEAYALDDPFVRALFIFAGPDERRLFEADVDPVEVGVIGCCYLRPVLAQRMVGTAPGELRWIGMRNMLLLVGGPAEFDAGLRRSLEEAFN